MGLDIYLRRFEDFEGTQAKEAQYESESEKVWESFGKYDDLTQEQKDTARSKTEAIAAFLGLDEYGSDASVVKIEQDSAKHPEHLFKIGYFRSSYNESGINRILRNSIGLTLESIFNPPDHYTFQPDWQLAKSVTEKAIADFSEYVTKTPYRVSKFVPDEFNEASSISSESAALEVFKAELESHKDSDFGAYSNRRGDFFLKEPLSVAAIVKGSTESFFSSGSKPCHYIIFKDETMYWYLQALEIVLETINYVLSQPDANKYYLAWSG